MTTGKISTGSTVLLDGGTNGGVQGTALASDTVTISGATVAESSGVPSNNALQFAGSGDLSAVFDTAPSSLTGVLAGLNLNSTNGTVTVSDVVAGNTLIGNYGVFAVGNAGATVTLGADIIKSSLGSGSTSGAGVQAQSTVGSVSLTSAATIGPRAGGGNFDKGLYAKVDRPRARAPLTWRSAAVR